MCATGDNSPCSRDQGRKKEEVANAKADSYYPKIKSMFHYPPFGLFFFSSYARPSISIAAWVPPSATFFFRLLFAKVRMALRSHISCQSGRHASATYPRRREIQYGVDQRAAIATRPSVFRSILRPVCTKGGGCSSYVLLLIVRRDTRARNRA